MTRITTIAQDVRALALELEREAATFDADELELGERLGAAARELLYQAERAERLDHERWYGAQATSRKYCLELVDGRECLGLAHDRHA